MGKYRKIDIFYKKKIVTALLRKKRSESIRESIEEAEIINTKKEIIVNNLRELEQTEDDAERKEMLLHIARKLIELDESD